MGTIETRVCDIPMDQLTSAEGFALESLQMDKERVMKRYADPFESTLKRCFEELKCQGKYGSFAISSNNGCEIELEGGVILKSKMLAEALALADEVIAYVVTVNGHDEIVADPENSMFETMFLNAWGSGFSMSGHRWLKKALQDHVREGGRYAGRGWIPGEEGIEIGLQNELFTLIDPGQIGVTLTGSIMKPTMSVNGFMGISDNPEIQNVGSDAS